MGGKADRRLAVERYLRGAQRFSHYAVAWRQSIRRRGYPHSRPAELGSRLQRESDSGIGRVQENRPVLRPQCLLAAADRDLWQPVARRASRSGLVQRGHVVVQTSDSTGGLESTVSGGVLQHLEPREL